MVGGSYVDRHSFKRGKKKKVQKNRARAPKSSQSKKSKVDKSQTECFFCKRLGH